MSDQQTEGWYLMHWTHDPRREIGSVNSTIRTTAGKWDHNPLERLEAIIQSHDTLLLQKINEYTELERENEQLRRDLKRRSVERWDMPE